MATAGMLTNIVAATTVCTVLAGICYFLYRALGPQPPIPGIPYSYEARNSFLGDLPAMLALGRKQPSTWYFQDQCIKHNTAIMQFWVRPFARPWVVVTDGREGQDAMTRRSKTFDRSRDLTGDAFRAYVPGSQITQPTGSEWKYNRRLVSETMMPNFLDHVAAERTSDAITDLVALWREKIRLAPHYTFECREDLHFATTDAIWAMTFGTQLESCRSQTSHLSELTKIVLPIDAATEIVTYPTVSPPPAFLATKLLTHSSKIAIQFGYKIHAAVLNILPRYRKAKAIRDALVYDRLCTAREKFKEGKQSQSQSVDCALDLIVQRELAAAKKEVRTPMTNDVLSRMHNELCLFLFAGATTTADTLAWGLKELSLRQDFQAKIRGHMTATYEEESKNGLPPPASALGKPSNPYMEALIYEVMRRRPISCGHFRTTLENTKLLDHDIPEGTEIIFATSGPSFVSPALPVSESRRSETSQADGKDRTRKWELQDHDSFRPERWLVEDESGKVQFDANAAPMLAFGDGPRGCFGYKFALLEMRIFYALVLWNFELEAIHPSLMDFVAVEELTINPKHVRIKLRAIR